MLINFMTQEAKTINFGFKNPGCLIKQDKSKTCNGGTS